MRTAAATAAPISSTSSSGWPRTLAARRTAQAVSRPSATPLPPAASRTSLPIAKVVRASAASMPRPPQAIISTAVGTPEPLLDRDPEDRDADGADEEVAEVGVDERRRQVAPPVAVDRADDGAEVQASRPGLATHQDQRRRDQDRRDHGVGALGEPLRALGPVRRRRARRDSCGRARRRGARASAPACAAGCRSTGTRSRRD